MKYVTFTTPGLLETRSLTTMGLSAKPNSGSPIGYFGTGLKYAVSVLLRLGAELEIVSGDTRLTFSTEEDTFRGTPYRKIVMASENWVQKEMGFANQVLQELPFTLNYGRNWEAWMALRELWSNTLDEGGSLQVLEDRPPLLALEGDTTTITISRCPEFEDAVADLSSIFHSPSDEQKLHAGDLLEISAGETRNLYYRGMRAFKVEKPCLYHYNLTRGGTLTEDRQLNSEYGLRNSLANEVAVRLQDEDLIEQIICAGEEYWENSLQPDSHVAPSAAFHRVMMRKMERQINAGWGQYYRQHDPCLGEEVEDPWADYRKPWRVEGEDVESAEQEVLFSRPWNMNHGVWERLASRLVEIANGGTSEGHRGPQLPRYGRGRPDLRRPLLVGCVNHPDREVREVLDGDPLCQECCNAWSRAEGEWQRSQENEERYFQDY